jgi:ABC-type transporter MlaC component
MSAFLSTFSAVFLAVVLGEVAKEAYQRYVKESVTKGFDKIDDHKSKITGVFKNNDQP